MKFTAQSDEFLTALQAAKPKERSSNIPILNCVRIAAAGGRLEILGHELDRSATASLAAEVNSEGASCTEADVLIRLLRSLPRGSHVLTVDDGKAMTVTAGRSRYRLNSLPADDMPAPLEPQHPVIVNIDKEAVAELFDRPAFAADANHPHFFVQGINLLQVGGRLAAEATDRHQMVRVVSSVLCGEVKSVIVPLTSIPAINKVGSAGAVLRWSDAILSVSSLSEMPQTFSTKLIDGQYPDLMRAVIPADGPYIEVETAALLDRVSRLHLVSGGDAVTRMSWDANPSTLEFDLERSTEGHEEIECEGASMKAGYIGVPSRKLVELVTAARGARCRLYLKSNHEPYRLVCPDDPDTILVQMPVRATAPAAQAA